MSTEVRVAVVASPSLAATAPALAMAVVSPAAHTAASFAVDPHPEREAQSMTVLPLASTEVEAEAPFGWAAAKFLFH